MSYTLITLVCVWIVSLIIVLFAAALGAGSKARTADVRVLDIISTHDDPTEAGRKNRTHLHTQLATKRYLTL